MLSTERRSFWASSDSAWVAVLTWPAAAPVSAEAWVTP